MLRLTWSEGLRRIAEARMPLSRCSFPLPGSPQMSKAPGAARVRSSTKGSPSSQAPRTSELRWEGPTLLDEGFQGGRPGKIQSRDDGALESRLSSGGQRILDFGSASGTGVPRVRRASNFGCHCSSAFKTCRKVSIQERHRNLISLKKNICSNYTHICFWSQYSQFGVVFRILRVSVRYLSI